MSQEHRGPVASAPRFLADFDLRRVPSYYSDVLVIGSGVAGLSAALAAAQSREVIVVCKDVLSETNTEYAQGGIAAALAPEDSFALHADDTLSAAQGLASEATVKTVVEGAPASVERLLAFGAQFDRDAQGDLALAREGGHSTARILHSHGASTGREIQRALSQATRAHERIDVFERVFILDLLTNPDGECTGALGWSASGGLIAFGAAQTILATGGAGQIYRETTNPVIATADGIAMAYRAGAVLRDLEFVQFHPTTLYIAGAARVLISEVVRGAGGVLRDRQGAAFMTDLHPDADLAPRDVVSRAINRRMVDTHDTNVYLDLSSIKGDLEKQFPLIAEICRFFDIDIRKDWIPVRPGAHYFIGGVEADLRGRTNLPRLYAIGECSSSGLHGANRIGSNSLLEGMVFGRIAGEDAAAHSQGGRLRLSGRGEHDGHQDSASVGLNLDDMTYSLKSLMGRDIGVERGPEGLSGAVERLSFWSRYLHRFAFTSTRGWELVNMLTVSHLVALSATRREESRGVHFRSDFPERDDRRWRGHTAVERRDDGPAFRFEPVTPMTSVPGPAVMGTPVAGGLVPPVDRS